MCMIAKRNYPSMVINCEIRIVIYTFFKNKGKECFRKD
jgi:hypothetical protein